MLYFYYKRVISGEKLWTDIPGLWREEVCDLLQKDGYTLNDDGTVFDNEMR